MCKKNPEDRPLIGRRCHSIPFEVYDERTQKVATFYRLQASKNKVYGLDFLHTERIAGNYAVSR